MEFQVDIKALTFNSAKKANTSPYPRKLMREGIGNQANVFKETDLLITKIPQKNTNSEYIIGIGDELIHPKSYMPFEIHCHFWR